MLIALVVNFLLLLSLIGHSFFFKNVILSNSSKIKNLDIFFGVFFLIFLSLTLNFFFPIKFFVFPIYFIGLFFFFYCLFKKKFSENLLKYLLIIFFTTFVSFNNGNNVDSPMYHLQVLKWVEESKIVFGLVNLEIRFGMNSIYHSLLPLLNISIGTFSAKYYISAIFLTTLIYESTRLKIKLNKIETSQIFLFFSTFYLIFFSLIHPFHNGIIFNHLGNPETDIFAMIIYFFLIFVIIKIIKEKKDQLFEIFLILLFLCVSSRLSYVPLILLVPLLFDLKYRILNTNKILTALLLFTTLFWFLRTFILSGCFIYPIHQTCIDTPWSIDISIVKSLSETVTMYARGMISGNHDNYDFTIATNQWLKPWIIEYFLSSALIQISLAIIFFSFIYLILLKFFINKKFNLANSFKFELKIIFVHILLFIVWYRAPEIRFLWGPLIGFPLFLLSSAIFLDSKFHFFIFKSYNQYKIFFFLKIGIFILLFFKNYSFYDLSNSFVISKKIFNYSQIKKFKTVGKFDIYSAANSQCADFKGICVNAPKQSYFFDTNYGYMFIKSH